MWRTGNGLQVGQIVDESVLMYGFVSWTISKTISKVTEKQLKAPDKLWRYYIAARYPVYLEEP